MFSTSFSGYCHSCLVDSSAIAGIICRLFEARGIPPRSKTVIPLPRMYLRVEFDLTMTRLMLVGDLKDGGFDNVLVGPGSSPPLITPHRPHASCAISGRQGGSTTSTITISSSNQGTSGPSTQQNSPVVESSSHTASGSSTIATLQCDNSNPDRGLVRLGLSGASNVPSGSGNSGSGDTQGAEVRRQQARMNLWQSDKAKCRRESTDSSRASKSWKSSTSDPGPTQNISDTEPVS